MAIKIPKGMAQTVLGPISPDKLGLTDPHEHLLLDLAAARSSCTFRMALLAASFEDSLIVTCRRLPSRCGAPSTVPPQRPSGCLRIFGIRLARLGEGARPAPRSSIQG